MALRAAARLLSAKAAPAARSVSTFSLPDLKYSYSALEPYFDEKTMTVHHTRHHQTYVSNLNGVLTGDHGAEIQVSISHFFPIFSQIPPLVSPAGPLSNHNPISIPIVPVVPAEKGLSLADIQKKIAALPDPIRTTVMNHGGGHYNHCLFFSTLAPETDTVSAPVDELKTKVDSDFGSFDAMRKLFDATAMKVFGSGWAWLGVDSDGKLAITSTRNQENPLMHGIVSDPTTPIMALDIWEHAMYLKYLNRRPEYIDAFWHIIDWEQVAANYASAREGSTAIFDVPMEE